MNTTSNVKIIPVLSAATAAKFELSEEQTLHVGYWRTSEGEDSPIPWPGDYIDFSMPPEERERVAAILDANPPTETYRGHHFDRLDPSVATGSREVTAKGYTYPEGLAYYVRTYGLHLPKEFLEAIG